MVAEAASGAPVPGASIDFSGDGASLGSATTTEEAVARLQGDWNADVARFRDGSLAVTGTAKFDKSVEDLKAK